MLRDTQAPMQRKLIATALLSPTEREWVDQFHKKCFERVSPLLPQGSLGYAWLERETAPL